jgi:hypothetical protein
MKTWLLKRHDNVMIRRSAVKRLRLASALVNRAFRVTLCGLNSVEKQLSQKPSD